MIGGILTVLLSGFVIGAAARWAVPGPDPMPAWLTIGIGMVGSIVGGGAAAALFGTGTSGGVFAILIGSILAAALLVVAYRRFVQRRPIVGPEAYRMPSRGFGVARTRKLLGLDEEPKDTSSREGAIEELRKLGELRGSGAITEEEFEARKKELLERL